MPERKPINKALYIYKEKSKKKDETFAQSWQKVREKFP